MPNAKIPLCECGYLRRQATQADSPIRFDATLNEYHFVQATAHLIIHHCPFCGGRAPQSRRPTMFAVIAESERQRLSALTASLHTVEDAIEAFGPPDFDCPAGIVSFAPQQTSEVSEPQTYRVLVYRGLSDTADLEVQVDSAAGTQIHVVPKYVGSQNAQQVAPSNAGSPSR
jgi:hypothetical protein